MIIVSANARTLLDLHLYEDTEQISLPDLVEHDSTSKAETETAAVLDDDDDRKKGDRDQFDAARNAFESETTDERPSIRRTALI
ncbi:hypothetical protein CV102_22365 [Natronococcus pandeyae]|uniref:Uncharacterized protein n=1 Tax=Natronococcus pandeyae TaxID=2055836 RepID=A0A8J8PZ88_9EURY|nr:hypothetical protein CV102_22365 [Natronococcus pandeyae]